MQCFLNSSEHPLSLSRKADKETQKKKTIQRHIVLKPKQQSHIHKDVHAPPVCLVRSIEK
jgi:hypothetical protein